MKLQQGFEWNCDLTVCLEREKGVEVSVKVWDRCVRWTEGKRNGVLDWMLQF